MASFKELLVNDRPDETQRVNHYIYFIFYFENTLDESFIHFFDLVLSIGHLLMWICILAPTIGCIFSTVEISWIFHMVPA